MPSKKLKFVLGRTLKVGALDAGHKIQAVAPDVAPICHYSLPIF
jgi:hypothetical protein